jgi:hypothetical protein
MEAAGQRRVASGPRRCFRRRQRPSPHSENSRVLRAAGLPFAARLPAVEGAGIHAAGRGESPAGRFGLRSTFLERACHARPGRTGEPRHRSAPSNRNDEVPGQPRCVDGHQSRPSRRPRIPRASLQGVARSRRGTRCSAGAPGVHYLAPASATPGKNSRFARTDAGARARVEVQPGAPPGAKSDDAPVRYVDFSRRSHSALRSGCSDGRDAEAAGHRVPLKLLPCATSQLSVSKTRTNFIDIPPAYPLREF